MTRYKKARRIGVDEEYLWLWADGRLLAAKNVEKEKELPGISHYTLATQKGVKNVTDDTPRGFVTLYNNGKAEVQTYGPSFWEIPSRAQDRIETYFGLKPGQYEVSTIEVPRMNVAMSNDRIILSLAILSKTLKKMGLHKDAGDMVNLLNDLLDATVEKEEKEEKYPTDTISTMNGLREDGTHDNMNQGFSVEPIWSGVKTEG